MLNPFSISLAVQPLKIYSGLCLNEGSSLTHRAPLILGEKTNSCPADTCLTVQFPSPGDAQPFLAVIPHHLCSPTNTSGPPWLWGCPSAKHPVLRYPLLPMGHGDAPLGGGGPACHAPLPARGWGRQQDRAVLQILFCGAAHSQALITVLLQGPAWRGWIPGSGQAPRASRAPETALMYFDRT